MKCLENLSRVNYTPELVMNLVKLYRYKGKDFYYEDVLKTELNGIIRTTIEHDTFYASKILNLNITDARLKSLTKGSSQPKNNDEQIVANLKSVFTIIQDSGENLELTDNEFLRMAEKVFQPEDISFGYTYEDVQHNLLTERVRKSKRDEFKREIFLYNTELLDENHEPTQLMTNLYIDILNFQIYNKHNEFLCLLIYYCLMFRERFNVFKYSSFFQMYYERFEEFRHATAKASYNWDLGYAKTDILNTLTIDMLLKGYIEAENRTMAVKIDKKMSKLDNVCATILKLKPTFTREDIINANPNFSESTINRALKLLKDQGKIRSNGTGRSATWIRIVQDEMFVTQAKQLSLFDLASGENDN